MNAELKPCPFCGSHDVELEDISDENGELWMIQCNGCGISVCAPGGEDGCCDATKEECVAAWNRRSDQKMIVFDL